MSIFPPRAVADNEADMFYMLADIHHVRMRFIVDHLLMYGLPIEGSNVLDVGCGIGLVSESMARLGGVVLGIDSSEIHIGKAMERASSFGLAIKYQCAAIESFSADMQFDIITVLEVIEHCDAPTLFLKSCVAALRPGGVIFISTLSKTAISFLTAKILAEYVLHLLPAGIHDWNNFISPGDLGVMLDDLDVSIHKINGISRDIVGCEWRLDDRLSVNYILMGVKTPKNGRLDLSIYPLQQKGML